MPLKYTTEQFSRSKIRPQGRCVWWEDIECIALGFANLNWIEASNVYVQVFPEFSQPLTHVRGSVSSCLFVPFSIVLLILLLPPIVYCVPLEHLYHSFNALIFLISHSLAWIESNRIIKFVAEGRPFSQPIVVWLKPCKFFHCSRDLAISNCMFERRDLAIELLRAPKTPSKLTDWLTDYCEWRPMLPSVRPFLPLVQCYTFFVFDENGNSL